MKPKYLLLALLWHITTRFGESCRRGWINNGATCYKIYTNKEPFSNAQSKCLFESSNLVSITSSSTFQFLSRHIALTAADTFWVSLQQKNGSFIWSNNVTVASQPWVSLPQEPTTDSCFIFNGAKVISHPCSTPSGFICETQRTTPFLATNCSHQVNASFVGENINTCIYRTPKPTNFEDAKKDCTSKGGSFMDIFDIASEGLHNFYEYNVIQNDLKKYWSSSKFNESHVIWPSSWAFKVESDSHISWNSGTGECVTVVFNQTDGIYFHLYQTPCSDEAYMICQQSNSSETAVTATTPRPLLQQLRCPQGFNWKLDRVTGYCYWETSYETSRLSWKDARSYCQSYGGDLGSFHSVEEEKIGLSFQYGSLSHPYWIGLTLDTDTLTYKWADGSSVDYTNWAPGQPDNKDLRRRCVSMDAAAMHWVVSLCGILSWFVCKVPQQVNPRVPILPTQVPLQNCNADNLFYFDDNCYMPVAIQHTWHRAQEYCEDKGLSLVSIHSENEIEFLLRMIYDDKSLSGNRVWIGLNSFGLDGQFKWTDFSPVDFTYWNENEPNNYRNQEKCSNMYTGNGLWNDENCSAKMAFICKRINDTSQTRTIPTTPDPRIGNCREGWFPYYDRCYHTFGVMPQDRVNWTEASEVCNSHGSYLVSVRNERDQTLLTYLMQNLKNDTWIGLHDTIKSGAYYWTDNSDMQYTNWAHGEPSFYGLAEDCVAMGYKESGQWKDDVCTRKLPFICQTRKDTKLPESSRNRNFDCLYPEGWLKLENMCFKMFEHNDLTWEEAETSCRRQDAHLISISSPSMLAVAKYLAMENNQSFWIGLKFEQLSRQMSWLNGWPMEISKWEKNQPRNLSGDNLCFSSSAEGYWKPTQCINALPYICQITTGQSPTPKYYTGNCSSSSELWHSSAGSYCYIFQPEDRIDWYNARLRCFSFGSHLVSIHSIEDLENLRDYVGNSVPSIFIGLSRNEKGGFAWLDNSPMDFVNWDQNQPSDDNKRCVEMMTDSLKWRIAWCHSRKAYVCSSLKSQEVAYRQIDIEEPSSRISTVVISGIVIVVIIVILAVVAVILHFKSLVIPRFRLSNREHSMSFENALFNVDPGTMEFQENKDYS